MVFPYTPLEQRIEILLDGVWTDITVYVQRRDNLVRIQRGRSDQASSMERSMATMSINNQDGRFTIGNPVGPYYGSLNLNTPMRISLPAAAPYLRMTGKRASDRITAPDAAPLDITGDIDVRIDQTLDSWRTAQNFAGKWSVSGGMSWVLQMDGDGRLCLVWTTGGDLTTLLESVSTAPVPLTGDHRTAVRATLDVNNGAGGHTVTFYTSDTLAGSWTQLGDPVVTTGTTSIYSSNSDLDVGGNELDGGPAPEIQIISPTTGEIHGFELRSGIGGTVVANPDFTIQTPGDTSFADTAAAPNTWTITSSTVSIDDRDYRFHGEVPAWPSQWDSTGTDIWVTIQASGVTRRLDRPNPTSFSALRRAMTKTSDIPWAYWPCEDQARSLSLASALPEAPAMEVTGSPRLATDGTFDCSDNLPVVANSSWNGAVPEYDPFGLAEFKFLMKIDSAGITDGVAITRLFTTGTSYTWDIGYLSAGGGSIRLLVWNSAGVLVHTGASLTGLNGLSVRVTLKIVDDGAGNISYELDWVDVFTAATGLTAGAFSGYTLGAVERVYVSPGSDVGEAIIGHISVRDFITDEPLAPLQAYLGEAAGRRIERLCGEEELDFRVIGDPDDTITMGPQLVASVKSLIDDAVITDGGMLYEPRKNLELGYRTRLSLVNQPVTLTLNYPDGELFGEVRPMGDDQGLVNDATVTRALGSSARFTATTGNRTPALIGFYPEQIAVNSELDTVLEDIAGWAVHQGTVEKDRFQTLSIDLSNARIAADTALVADAQLLDMGDRMNVTNPLEGQAPDTIDQLIQGSLEVLGNFEHAITWNTSPASSWDVLQLDDETFGRLDSAASTLGLAATDSATTMVVHAAATADHKPSRPWTEDAGEYPFDLVVGGERVTATAAAPLVADTFTRTVAAGGWGTASDGHTYTLTGGNASDRSVAATYGLVTLASAPTTIRHQTVAETCRDTEIRATVAVSAIATGGSLVAGILARWTSSTDYYQVRVEFTTSSTIALSVTRGATVIGAASVATGLTYTAGSTVEVRVRLSGDRVLARVWINGTIEASYWHIDRTVTSSTIPDGVTGLSASGLTGNTNVNPEIRFHDWLTFTPQKFTVTRSVNSIVKAHAIGTRVNLARPVVISL